MNFNYVTKKGEKKTKEVIIDDFVRVKNWKSIGNKLIGYNRLSSFKIVEGLPLTDEKDEDSENLELTLF